jgi:cellulose synthase operon protein C
MGTKTIKRLAILSGAIALLGGSGYFLWAFQVERMARNVVKQAEEAEQAKDYAKAQKLYREHLAVVPDDVEVQRKYAETFVQGDQVTNGAEEALGIFEDILNRYPGRDDVRRRAAEVAATFGGGMLEKARSHLEILLKAVKDDGHLEYLMGRCYEQEHEFDQAAKYYGSAIEHGAPEQDRLEAFQRRAELLRDKLGRTDEADRVIDEMVKSAPKDDYRVYLARGRYRSRQRSGGGKGSVDDFRKALELAPHRPEVYVEAAEAVDRESGHDAAREILDKGLEATPKSVDVYLVLANLEERAARPDRAVEALELGLKKLPDDLMLHWQLAVLLASRGESEAGRLLMQVAELERLAAPRPFTQYLTAFYHVNKHEFARARQILTPLQADVGRNPMLKARVNQLLAQCYAEMNESELQRDATLRAYIATPEDPSAKMAWIQDMVNRGEFDEAIREYQGLLTSLPGVRPRLAELMILRNRGVPESRRQWDEVERVIAAIEASTPEAVEPALLRAQMLLVQGQEPKAYDVIETARARFPKDVRPWITQVDMLAGQKKFDQAQKLLDQARQPFGDRVDLRLARQRLAVNRGGPQVVPTLNALAEDIGSFSRVDRGRLLMTLAGELGRQQDLTDAMRLWTQLAADEPQTMRPRLQLFEMALQKGDTKQAEQRIQEIEKLDEQSGHFCRAQYLFWQSRNTNDAAAKEKARTEARVLLTELKARRPDWSKIPLVLAMLDEDELTELGQDETRSKEKLESAITSYRRAIDLGNRDLAVVRHCIQLLFRAGRASEALEIYSRTPAVGQLASDAGRLMSLTQIALANRDFRQAEEIARKAVAASPEDFQARLWLARVLVEARQPAEAETVLRQAVDAAKTDPDRWTSLVLLLIQNRQTEKAEQVVREAEASIAKSPLAMAQCCQVVGGAFAAADPDKAKSWYGQARRWYDRAQEQLKDPNDLSVKRRLAMFLIQTNQAAEAEGVLKEILTRTADGKSSDLAALARRSLAQLYAQANPPRTAEALALLGSKAGQGGDPDDLRVRALVHEVQGTPEGRKQAIADLETLVSLESATSEDRRRLAQLLEAAGEWPRAREQFLELVVRTDGARDVETLNRRFSYLTLFVEALIRHHKAGDDADLAEARRLVEKLEPLQRDGLVPLLLAAQIDRAANQPDAAMARIREFAVKQGMNTVGRLRLAEAVERIGLLDAAEWIYRHVADEPPVEADGLPNQARLALYLGRHGRVKDALDICESLWTKEALREKISAVSVQIICDPSTSAEAAQINRVVGWLEQARAQNPQSIVLLIGLANIYEWIGNYAKAEELYRVAIRINDRDGIASNNLAWLIALRGNGKGPEALELINSAIRAKGAVPEYLDTRGVVHLASGDGQRAVADLETALKNAPTPPKYFHLAQAYLALNEKEKARKVLQAGKTRGLPGGLHRLEVVQYKKVASELGVQ